MGHGSPGIVNPPAGLGFLHAPDPRDPYHHGIIQRASRLWHGVQEHPLLERTLARLPRPDRSNRVSAPHPDQASQEIRKLAESLFPDVFAAKP